MASAAEFVIPNKYLPDEGALGEIKIIKNNIPDFAEKTAAYIIKNYTSKPFTKTVKNDITNAIMKYLFDTYPEYKYIEKTTNANLYKRFRDFIFDNIASGYSLYGPNRIKAQQLNAEEKAKNREREREYSEEEHMMSDAEKNVYLSQIKMEEAAVRMIISTIDNTIPELPPRNDYGMKMLLSSPNPIVQKLGEDIQARRKAYQKELALKEELENKKAELEEEIKGLGKLIDSITFGGKRSTRKRKTRKHSKKSRSHRKSSKKTIHKRSTKRRN